MDTFKSELATDFRVELEGKHVVPKQNFLAMNMVTGPNGVVLNAGYKNAETFQFKDEIGVIVERVCHLVPHGLLVFFPSYRLKESVVERWKSTDQWDQISKLKSVFEEPKGSNRRLFEETMADFEECIEGGGGAVLLAVCRGKVSEGVDFANNAARAVITIGLPFPNWRSLEVKDKRDYNDRHSRELNLLSGQDWYTIQAFRAINQALGRCLRHINDWGAIIMIESRIAGNERYRKNISRWVRDEMISVVRCDEAFDRLEVFCTEKEREGEERKAKEEEEKKKKETERKEKQQEEQEIKEEEQATMPSPETESKSGSSSSRSDAESEGSPSHQPYPTRGASPAIPLFSRGVAAAAAPVSPETVIMGIRDVSSGSETESPDEDLMIVSPVRTNSDGNDEVPACIPAVTEVLPRGNLKPSPEARKNITTPSLFKHKGGNHSDIENHNNTNTMASPSQPVPPTSHLLTPTNVAKRPRLSRIKPDDKGVALTNGSSSSARGGGLLPVTPEILERYYKCQRCKNQIIRSCVSLCCRPPCGNISIKGLIKGSYHLGTVPSSPDTGIVFRTESKDRPGCSSIGCFPMFCSGCKEELGTVEFLFGSAYVGGAVALNYF